MERFCVFDIETVRLAEAETYLEPPKPRANLKDPAKIAADVTEKTTALLERAALDPDLCRIVAVGWEGGGLAESAVCENAVEERRVLERFWQASRGASALASHKVHTCVEHHRLMGLRWIDVTWTTPEHPVASLQFRQVRGTEVG
jgi:hypothetical protein